MGNIGSCCGTSEGTENRKMVPADLHSSGAQQNKKAAVQQKGNPRPDTLQCAQSAANTAANPAGVSSKYSGFSLHGVQKTSPLGYSNESLSTQDKAVRGKFLAKNVVAFFGRYKEKHCDEILEDGVARFCGDLNVDPAEFVVLALAWKFKAATMCKFTREEFTQGCISLQVDSIESLLDALPSLENEALTNFRDVYKFAFQFGLDTDQGQRTLPCDVAIGMWQVVFSKQMPALLNEWITFLNVSKVRGISRDTWNMFLHFTDNIATDLSNYDDSEAWPSLFDDFVEYYRTLADKQEKSGESSQQDSDSASELKVNEESGEKEENVALESPHSDNSSDIEEVAMAPTQNEEEVECVQSEPVTSDNLHS